MIAGGIEADRAFLERYSPERDRAEFERAWKELPSAAATGTQAYEPHYEGSSVVLRPAGRGRAASTARTRSRRAAGPPPRRRSSLSAAATCSRSWAPASPCSRSVPRTATSPAFERAAAASGVPLTVVRDTLDGGRDAYGCRLILVRPDQFVSWTGDRAPDDVPALLATVTGR